MTKHRIALLCLLAFFVCLFVACGGGGSGSGPESSSSQTVQEFDIGELTGWIRHTCSVYPSSNKSDKPVGYMPRGCSVGVTNDGSGWLRLRHGPVNDEITGEMLDEYLRIPKGQAWYIEISNFTTELPYKWINDEPDKPKITRHQKREEKRTEHIEKAKSKPKPKKKLDPAVQEKAATLLMKFAKEQIEKKQPAKAKKWLDKILKRYPKTDTAKEAKKILETIK